MGVKRFPRPRSPVVDKLVQDFRKKEACPTDCGANHRRATAKAERRGVECRNIVSFPMEGIPSICVSPSEDHEHFPLRIWQWKTGLKDTTRRIIMPTRHSNPGLAHEGEDAFSTPIFRPQASTQRLHRTFSEAHYNDTFLRSVEKSFNYLPGRSS